MVNLSTVTVEWVCGEGTARAFAARVESEGGTIRGTTPFVPEPDEADLYSDGQFEPLVVVGIVLASGMVLRHVRELVLDLRGREIAVIDMSGKTLQVRIVPVGTASQVIVKSVNGTVTRFSPSDIDKIEQTLVAILPATAREGSSQ